MKQQQDESGRVKKGQGMRRLGAHWGKVDLLLQARESRRAVVFRREGD